MYISIYIFVWDVPWIYFIFADYNNDCIIIIISLLQAPLHISLLSFKYMSSFCH